MTGCGYDAGACGSPVGRLTKSSTAQPDPACMLTRSPGHRQLSKLAQAFSSAGIYYYPLLSSIVKAAELKLPEFDPASLSNLMKCLSRLNYPVCSALQAWMRFGFLPQVEVWGKGWERREPLLHLSSC